MSLAADQTEQSRLSRAVRPDERAAFARRDGKTYPVHGVKTFKGLRDTGEAQSEIARVRHNGQFPLSSLRPQRGKVLKDSKKPGGDLYKLHFGGVRRSEERRVGKECK